MNHWHHNVSQAGLGLRRGLVDILSDLEPGDVDFMEVAPENWIDVGGQFAKQLRAFSECYPITLHGLSLNIGGPEPLDAQLIKNIKEINCR